MSKISTKNNRKLFCFITVLTFTVLQLEANFTPTNNQNLNRKAWSIPQLLDTNEKIKIFIAHTVIGLGIDTALFQSDKIHAAMNFITMLNNDYELISQATVTEASQKLEPPFTAFDIANEISADRIFIIKVEQLMNILRAEIISAFPPFVNPPDTVSTNVSEGFSLLRFFKKSNHDIIYDPALLIALQRAFAVSENDSLMFQNTVPHIAKPAPNLVIAGIEFINDSKFTNWEIFNSPLVNSYEYCELIFETINQTENWVVFDIDSRDVIYELFNLFLIENHIAPSANELSALRNFGVFHFISGRLERNRNGIKFTLTLNKMAEIENSNLGEIIEIKSVSETLHKNDVVEPKNIIRRLARELIE